MDLLECKNLSKKYKDIVALDCVNLKISKGKIIGILGGNGAGKSTLYKLINDILIPSSGEVLFKGHSIGIESKKRIAYFPEKSYLDNSQKVKEVLKFFNDFYDNFNIKKAYKYLEQFKIDEEFQLSRMSKGMLTTFRLILVISRNADLYILDEPFDGVDLLTKNYIINDILKDYKEKASILISTHFIKEIENILDEVIFLDKGRIVLSSSCEELRKKENSSIENIFGRMFKC